MLVTSSNGEKDTKAFAKDLASSQAAWSIWSKMTKSYPHQASEFDPSTN
jgi:hypothetical protein